MAFKLKGKEEKFFSILNDHAVLCHEAGLLLVDAFKGEIDPDEALKEIS